MPTGRRGARRGTGHPVHVRPPRPAAGRAPDPRRTPPGSDPRPASPPATPSATIRPSVHDRDAREEVGGQREVVEHGHDRRAVAPVEVGEQLHDLDLVADVEVRGRFVEDEDRRGLRDGDGDEDELPLAHRQLPDVAVGARCAIPTRSIAPATAARSRRTQPGERRLVGQPAERDDLVDRHRERESAELRHHGDGPGDGRPRSTAAIGVAAQADLARTGLQHAGQRPQQASTCRRRSGRRARAVRPGDRQVAPDTMRRSP